MMLILSYTYESWPISRPDRLPTSLDYPGVRHGYPWVPTDQAHGHPRQVDPPTRRTADLLVGPTDLVGDPHDLLKTFQKIPQTT
jgi:hypothetical protein